MDTLGHYKILDRLGAGGLGEVYRARDTRLGRTVAIKLVPDQLVADPARRARLLQDARRASALSHPNVATLYEIGEQPDRVFLVFEFVPGETLSGLIGGRPLNPRRAVDIAIQIADALADAHAAGLASDDIRPDNIIVTPKGAAKLLDVGLSRWTAGGAAREHAATTIATGVGMSRETAAYLSPEQAVGERVDSRTDIFSLGIVLFEMLTGRVPFAGRTAADVVLQIAQATPPKLRDVNPALPPELEPVIQRALAKSLDQRYEAVATVAAELRAVGAILETRAMTAAPVMSRPSSRRRGRIGWWLAALLALLALAWAGWITRDSLVRVWHAWASAGQQ